MNAADLARLQLAKRAYQATEPRDAEVLAGVRRARLALTRPKPRRNWFSKGLVLVVLAIGSLAYAKPQAMGELLERLRPGPGSDTCGRMTTGVIGPPLEAAIEAGNARRQARSRLLSVDTRLEDTTDGSRVSAPESAGKLAAAAAKRKPNAAPVEANAAAALTPVAVADLPAKPPSATTDWGRVGQALARGDETEALSALGQLSESDDQRTRDKADLGRAQLLMAHGEPDEACALARSLTHRRAGGRIERQAQLLLKSCGR